MKHTVTYVALSGKDSESRSCSISNSTWATGANHLSEVISSRCGACFNNVPYRQFQVLDKTDKIWRTRNGNENQVTKNPLASPLRSCKSESYSINSRPAAAYGIRLLLYCTYSTKPVFPRICLRAHRALSAHRLKTGCRTRPVLTVS